MNAVTDLDTLIQNLEPRILSDTYVFCSLEDADYGALSHTVHWPLLRSQRG